MPSQRSMLLAAAPLLLWNGAFAASGRFGIRLPICAAALALDALCLGFDPDLRRVRVPAANLLALGAAAAAAQIAATYGLFPVAVRAWPQLAPRVADLYRILGASAGAALLAPTAFVAASEELVFRGAVQGRIAHEAPAWARTLAAALLYSLSHIASGEPVLVALALACGLFWGALRAASGSLVPGLVAHLAWNAAVMFVHPLRLG